MSSCLRSVDPEDRPKWVVKPLCVLWPEVSNKVSCQFTMRGFDSLFKQSESSLHFAQLWLSFQTKWVVTSPCTDDRMIVKFVCGLCICKVWICCSCDWLQYMPSQQAAHKNGNPNSVKDAHKSARACLNTSVRCQQVRQEQSHQQFYWYDPKHIRKSKLVNDLPP